MGEYSNSAGDEKAAGDIDEFEEIEDGWSLSAVDLAPENSHERLEGLVAHLGSLRNSDSLDQVPTDAADSIVKQYSIIAERKGQFEKAWRRWRVRAHLGEWRR